MLTVPLYCVPAEYPFAKLARTTLPYTDTLSWKVRVLPEPTKGYKSPFVCMRPAKPKFGPLKNERSFSENTPNWNTGIRDTCACRIMLTSCPPGSAAVVCIVTGMICAHKPWFGPAVIWPNFAVRTPEQPDCGATE